MILLLHGGGGSSSSLSVLGVSLIHSLTHLKCTYGGPTKRQALLGPEESRNQKK